MQKICLILNANMQNFENQIDFPFYLVFNLLDLAHVDVVELAQLLLDKRLNLLDLPVELARHIVQLVLKEDVSGCVKPEMLHRK